MPEWTGASHSGPEWGDSPSRVSYVDGWSRVWKCEEDAVQQCDTGICVGTGWHRVSRPGQCRRDSTGGGGGRLAWCQI